MRGFHEFLPLGKCFLDGKYEEGERKDRSVSENGHVRRRRCLVYGVLLHADYRSQSPFCCEEMVSRRRAVKAASQTDQRHASGLLLRLHRFCLLPRRCLWCPVLGVVRRLVWKEDVHLLMFVLLL